MSKLIGGTYNLGYFDRSDSWPFHFWNHYILPLFPGPPQRRRIHVEGPKITQQPLRRSMTGRPEAEARDKSFLTFPQRNLLPLDLQDTHVLEE